MAAKQIAFDQEARESIMRDPAWEGGRYDVERRCAAG